MEQNNKVNAFRLNRHQHRGHSEWVKRGIVLGFFLRAYRICSKEYIDEEIQHIISSFTKLKYPKGFLLNLKTKALQIRRRFTTYITIYIQDIRYITIYYDTNFESSRTDRISTRENGS